MTSNNNYFEYLKKRSNLGFLYRKYSLYPQLSRHLKGHTLDIGCGIGDMLLYRKNTIGVDINPHTVEFCNARGADARLMTGSTLPFLPNEFSSVLMDNVLEHIIDPTELLAETRRVLNAKGKLLIGVPGIKGWNSDVDHKLFYDEFLLISTIEKMGFFHIKTFYTPIMKSKWLSRNVRQYCMYALFQCSE